MKKTKRKILPPNLEHLKGRVFSSIEKRITLRRLEKYAPEIKFVLNPYNKKSAEETMMIKGYRKSCQETTTRKTHAENLADISHLIAKGLNKKNPLFHYNYGILNIMSQYHDIGHTFLGHSGEWWISNIKEDYGTGYYVHNALGPRELIYTDKIYDKIIDTIKQRHPKISNKELDRIRGSLWIIMEGINSHNGERSEREYIPDLTKTEKQFEGENLNCHTVKDFDKTILPATPEASLMRICDKISYIPYDMVDGLREGFITGLNEEYRIQLRKLGITDAEIDECLANKTYEELVRKLQLVFIKDVIANSSGTTIRMSQEISKVMHELRNINNRQIVNYVVFEEDIKTYPPALRDMMNEFKEIILDENILAELEKGNISKERRDELIEKYKDSPNKGFIEYVLNTNPDDFAYSKRIIKGATIQSILDEQETARELVTTNGTLTDSPDFSLKNKRISEYIRDYSGKSNIGEYTSLDKAKDAMPILRNVIKQSNPKSELYLSMSERVALELGAKYLATLNDIEFMQLLRAKRFVDDKKFASLTRKYKDVDFKAESKLQPNWKTISQKQEESTQTI